jgi:hypothetical protein
MGQRDGGLMQVKLMKIPTKSFIMIFSTINVIAGFILGAIVTLVSIVAPDEQSAGVMGQWAILIFPILNGILGLATGAFLTALYNFLAPKIGGIELEFETIQ